MPLSLNEIRQRAINFGRAWSDEIRERAEAQTFWNEFFDVFGRSRRSVAAFEDPVKKIKGTYGYIDLIWPGKMIAEHKSKGASLDKAQSQAFEYVRYLIDEGRADDVPQYIIVSDFETIAINDTESDRQVSFPVRDLHKHIREFAFIAGYQQAPTDPEDPVNINAAEKLAKLKDALEEGGYPKNELERFMVRILFCLFAEDTGLLGEPDSFRQYIENATKKDGSDLGMHIAKWFEVLNNPVDKRSKHLDEQLAGLQYVNGELFADTLPFADFNRQMRDRLIECCKFDWSQISPAVFGSLFQSIMTSRERRQIGAHYTSERDILKVVNSLFLDELHERFNKLGKNKAALKRFHEELRSIKILDPACGCGNFLVVAYRELRRLETKVLQALHPVSPKALTGTQLALNIRSELLVDVDQMYGIEIEEWPAQIAKVALWLVDHQMNVELSLAFGQPIARLPLTHSATIINDNALRIDWNTVLLASECNYVLGNPPFVGKKARTKQQAEDMSVVFGSKVGIGTLDYVCCWYQVGVNYARESSAELAFVSTNSITQGEQPAILWSDLFREGDLSILFAHRTFPWTSEARGKAHVHVVVIGFGFHNATQKVIHDYSEKGEAIGISNPSNISPYLTDGPNSAIRNRSRQISGAPEMSFGSMPNDGGNLLLSTAERDELLERHPEANRYVKRLISSSQYLSGKDRWCLWLVDCEPGDIRRLEVVHDRVESVRQHREESTRQSTRKLASQPALFGEIRQPDQRYVLVPRHSSERRHYIPMSFFASDVIVSDSCMFVPHATLFHFGILHSEMHMAWVRQVCGRLESRYRYSARLVYNNFPWPADPSEKQIAAVESAAQGVLDARAQFPESSLADLYDPLAMPHVLHNAHKELDRAVDRCYRPQPFPDERRRFEYLFQLWEKLDQPLTTPKPKRRRR